jgi:hypothetical protein
MLVKGPSGGKFAQFVSHHIFRHEYGDKLPAVMDGEGQTHKVRGDQGSPGPGFNDLFAFLVLLDVHLFLQGSIYKRTFFRRTWH